MKLQFLGSMPLTYPTLGLGEVHDGDERDVPDAVGAELLKRPDLWRQAPDVPEPLPVMDPEAQTKSMTRGKAATTED